MINFRLQRGKFITLPHASKVFGYTPDHLAYLARKNYIEAKREGRRWFTTERAIEKYQKAMRRAGHPVVVSEQGRGVMILPTITWSLLVPNFPKISNINFKKPIQKNVDDLVTKENFSDSSQFSNYFQTYFSIAQTPNSLPISNLPWYMRITPWYKTKWIITPLFMAIISLLYLFPNIFITEINHAVVSGQKVLLQSTTVFETLIKNAELTSVLTVVSHPAAIEKDSGSGVAGITNITYSDNQKSDFSGRLPLADDRQGERLEAKFMNSYIKDKNLQEELKIWHKIYLKNISKKRIYR